MLELGSVPGDLLLLQAFYPFANNINVFLCTAVFAKKRWQIASAEKDGGARIPLKAGRGTLFWPGPEYYVETRC